MKYTASVEAVAQHFQVSAAAVRLWVRNELVPPHTYIKLPRRFRFDIQALEAHFSSHHSGAVTETVEDDPEVVDDSAPKQLDLFEQEEQIEPHEVPEVPEVDNQVDDTDYTLDDDM